MRERHGSWTLTRKADGSIEHLETRGAVMVLAPGLDSMGRLPVRMLASTEAVNTYGFIVENAAFAGALEAFNENPVLLAFHRMDQPVGKAPARLTEAGLEAIGWISSGRPDIQQFVRDGTLAGVSIGFTPLAEEKGDDDVLRIKKLELVEISLVPAGANPEAFVEPAELSKEAAPVVTPAPVQEEVFGDAAEELAGAMVALSSSAALMAVSSADLMMGGK